jgi:hypothetical protein
MGCATLSEQPFAMSLKVKGFSWSKVALGFIAPHREQGNIVGGRWLIRQVHQIGLSERLPPFRLLAMAYEPTFDGLERCFARFLGRLVVIVGTCN